MARMPGAEWLGEHSPRTPMTRYDIVCIHTIVGYAPAHAAHFSTWGDGRLAQSRDTAYRSAANLNGNPRVIAIENADHGPEFPDWTGSDVPPLTGAQVEACAQVLAWAHLEHDIPLQLAPDSRPGSRGLAYHRQGIDGNFGAFRFPGRATGGEVWTEHFGKVCPGDQRIAQLPDILARAKAIVNDPEEIDVKFIDLFRYRLFGKKQGSRTVADVLREDNKNLREIRAAVERIEAALAAPSEPPAPKA